MFCGGFINFRKSFDAAAYAIANTPGALRNLPVWHRICHQYGVDIDSMTDDEWEEFQRTVYMYAGY